MSFEREGYSPEGYGTDLEEIDSEEKADALADWDNLVDEFYSPETDQLFADATEKIRAMKDPDKIRSRTRELSNELALKDDEEQKIEALQKFLGRKPRAESKEAVSDPDDEEFADEEEEAA